MADNKAVSPNEALERLFEVVQQEARANPTFARRMLEVVGMTVTFQGNEAGSAVDPVLVAARNDFPSFREMFDSFAEKDIKTLIADFGLATKEQLAAVRTRPKKIGYVELMWDGAQRKLANRKGQ